MQKNEKGPLSPKNKMFKRSTSDDQLKSEQKMLTENTKRPPKSLKNKMFIFGLHSTSDDWPSNPSKKLLTKTQKNEKGPLSHQKIKCSFLNYIQLLMIGRNAIKQKTLTKRPPKSLKNKMFIFEFNF